MLFYLTVYSDTVINILSLSVDAEVLGRNNAKNIALIWMIYLVITPCYPFIVGQFSFYFVEDCTVHSAPSRINEFTAESWAR